MVEEEEEVKAEYDLTKVTQGLIQVDTSEMLLESPETAFAVEYFHTSRFSDDGDDVQTMWVTNGGSMYATC